MNRHMHGVCHGHQPVQMSPHLSQVKPGFGGQHDGELRYLTWGVAVMAISRSKCPPHLSR